MSGATRKLKQAASNSENTDLRYETLSGKYPVVPGLIVTTLLSVLLLGAEASGWRSSSHFAQVMLENRSAIAIVVQVVSQVLGMVNVYALCTCPPCA
jgi:hypothetical protein